MADEFWERFACQWQLADYDASDEEEAKRYRNFPWYKITAAEIHDWLQWKQRVDD